jgi:lysozyme family protein
MAPTFAALRGDYDLLFDSCLIRPDRLPLVSASAARIAANRSRYGHVGESLGIPWFVVGLIHAMESGMNFDTHLHNGDPLTARTTHWPTGRPKSGRPPFTWEESAIDALTVQGLPAWKDWTVPGVLYELEGYNGWGYRGLESPIPTPYLWSFSNQYTRGKYVADGKFSPTAVSQQCGAAVLLKRLIQLGSVELARSVSRTLQLTNPYSTGTDVEEAQRLLASNPFGDFAPGEADGEYGPVTADATRRAKFALGYPDGKVNGSFGPLLQGFLDGTKPLPKGYEQRRDKRLAAAPAEATIRQSVVQWALWGIKNTALIAYSQGSNRLEALDTPGRLPLATDCSAFATLCYSWGKAPNPNADGAYDGAAGGYTGTMLKRCRHVAQSAAKPGDLVVWTPPADGQHVCIIVSDGPNPWLVSHGDDSGPKRLRFADEDAYQRQHGHGAAIYLSVF